MSLAHFVRRRYQSDTPDKPQRERIEHANLERPDARLHPLADVAKGTQQDRPAAVRCVPREAIASRAGHTPCQTDRPGA